MNASPRPLAVVTGASSGIGYELARECASNGFDLVIAADRSLSQAALECKSFGAEVQAVEADLASEQGISELIGSLAERKVDALLANAGHGLGGGFLDQPFQEQLHVINTNITGTLALIHAVGRDMRTRRSGRILITGSIAGFMPGSFKAVIDSFSWALRNELKASGVSVTCLMPGETDTEFFQRAGMMNTQIGVEKKADPAAVARIGFKAMMDGEGDVVAGFKNKLQAAIATVTPSSVLAEQHRKKAQPGSADH